MTTRSPSPDLPPLPDSEPPSPFLAPENMDPYIDSPALQRVSLVSVDTLPVLAVRPFSLLSIALPTEPPTSARHSTTSSSSSHASHNSSILHAMREVITRPISRQSRSSTRSSRSFYPPTPPAPAYAETWIPPIVKHMQSSPPSSQASLAASRPTPPSLLLDLSLETLFDTTAEKDDRLHSPGVVPPRKGKARRIYDAFDGPKRSDTNARGVINVSILAFLCGGLIFLFLFLPIYLAFRVHKLGQPAEASMGRTGENMGRDGFKTVPSWGRRCVRLMSSSHVRTKGSTDRSSTTTRLSRRTTSPLSMARLIMCAEESLHVRLTALR